MTWHAKVSAEWGNASIYQGDVVIADVLRSPAASERARLMAAAQEQHAALEEAEPYLETLHSILPRGDARNAVWRNIKKVRAALEKGKGND